MMGKGDKMEILPVDTSLIWCQTIWIMQDFGWIRMPIAATQESLMDMMRLARAFRETGDNTSLGESGAATVPSFDVKRPMENMVAMEERVVGAALPVMPSSFSCPTISLR